MNKRFITLISAVVFALISSVATIAQDKIDKLVASLEKESNVQVTYTERRNPQTKKIVRQSTILNGNRKQQAEWLWNAFEQERPNSVSVTKTGSKSFVIKFQDKNYISSYVLGVNGTSWSLVITKRGANEDDDDYSFNYKLNDLNGLDLSGLCELSALESLNNLGSKLQIELDNAFTSGKFNIYDENGELIINDKIVITNPGMKTTKPKKSKSDKNKSKSTATSTSVSVGGKRTTRTVTSTEPDGTEVITIYSI